MLIFWQMVIFKCYLRWIIKKILLRRKTEERGSRNLLGIYFHLVISASKQNSLFLWLTNAICMCIKKSKEIGWKFSCDSSSSLLYAVAFIVFIIAHTYCRHSFMLCIHTKIQKIEKFFSCWRVFPWVEFLIHSVIGNFFIFARAWLGNWRVVGVQWWGLTGNGFRVFTTFFLN